MRTRFRKFSNNYLLVSQSKIQKIWTFFFRIEVHLTSAGVHLSQTKYIINVHQKHVMTEAKPVKTPMTSYPKLTMSSGTQLSDPTSYRQLVGSLQYLDFWGWISLMQWIDCLSSCIDQLILTFKKRNEFYGISHIHQLMVFSSLQLTPSQCMPSPTRTGLVTLMITSPPTHLASTWAAIQYLGHQRNRKVLQGLQRRMSTGW